MTEMRTLEFKTDCGCTKYGKKWVVNDPHANVIIFEGMEEHAARYDRFAKFLNIEGINVFCLDTFGQGSNVKEDLSNIGVWPKNGFTKQLDHFHQLFVHIKETTKAPTYIFAHSMGSFYAQAFLEAYPGECERIVLCGSGAKNPALPIGHFLAWIITNKKNEQTKSKLLSNLMFGGFNKRIEHPETPFDWLSYNKDNVSKYIRDPLCGFGSRRRFCLEFIKGMRKIYKKENLEKLNENTSIFLITGEEDPVTHYTEDTNKLEEMYKEHGVKDVRKKGAKLVVKHNKVECALMKLGEVDKSGRRSPVDANAEHIYLEADTVIMAVGFRNKPMFNNDSNKLKVDDKNRIISFKYEFHQYKSYICEFKENTLIVNILEEDLNLFYDSSLYINDLNYKYNVIKEIKNGSYYEIYLNTDFNYNGYLNIVIKQPVTTIYKELKKGIKKWIS